MSAAGNVVFCKESENDENNTNRKTGKDRKSVIESEEVSVW